MNPSSVLWSQLIFRYVHPTALLSLRATCRGFRAQLSDPAQRPLWLALTMLCALLNYPERLLGWQGVEQSMKRAQITKENARNGTYVQLPVFTHEVEVIAIVACRIVVQRFMRIDIYELDGTTHLYGADEQFLLHSSQHITTMMDRWILRPLASQPGFGWFDCLTFATIPFIVYPDRWNNGRLSLSVQGRCFSFRSSVGNDEYIINRMSDDGIATVCAGVRGEHLRLCDGGDSYVCLRNDCMHMVDIQTFATLLYVKVEQQHKVEDLKVFNQFVFVRRAHSLWVMFNLKATVPAASSSFKCENVLSCTRDGLASIQLKPYGTQFCLGHDMYRVYDFITLDRASNACVLMSTTGKLHMMEDYAYPVSKGRSTSITIDPRTWILRFQHGIVHWTGCDDCGYVVRLDVLPTAKTSRKKRK